MPVTNLQVWESKRNLGRSIMQVRGRMGNAVDTDLVPVPVNWYVVVTGDTGIFAVNAWSILPIASMASTFHVTSTVRARRNTPLTGSGCASPVSAQGVECRET